VNEDTTRLLLVAAEAQRAQAGALRGEGDVDGDSTSWHGSARVVLGGGVVWLRCGERGQDGQWQGWLGIHGGQ
jgi:hypothetical protein